MKSGITGIAKKNRISYFYIPLSLIYSEVLLYILAGNILNAGNIIAMVFVSAASGLALSLLSSLTRSAAANRWIAFGFLECIAIVFMIAFFVQNTYQNYTNIATVFAGAGGILDEFSSALWNIITHNLFTIFLFELPTLLFLFLGPIFNVLTFERNQKKGYLILLAAWFCFELFGCLLTGRSQDNRIKLGAQYDFNTVVRCFNLQTGLKLDFCYLVFGNPYRSQFLPQTDTRSTAEEANAREYGTHTMGINFALLAEDSSNADIQKLNTYVASLPETSKNAYTGLFEGKNIIFITAESLSKEILQEDTMPHLTKLLNEGIYVEDFYQPYWNGSTATGEFANLLGILPTQGMHSFELTKDANLYFTLGNEMTREGYFTRAYHNGTVEYYDRIHILPNYGYEKFIANGNGMEDGLSGSWPESDLEMMQYALPQFIDHTPFCTYFMTLSGHFPYFYDLSIMVEKYEDRFLNQAHSEVVTAYLCSQVDLDEAVGYLLKELQNQGILDDTVIVISPDHNPYGLTKNDAWGTDRNYLPELFGYDPDNEIDRDHNALIIWTPSLAAQEQIVVEEPAYSVDILPTLLNLFGLPYDGRLLAGRDLLSATEGIAIWPDYSWCTEKGRYFALTDTFVPANGQDVSEAYIEEKKALVRNKMTFSELTLENNYYQFLFGQASSGGN